MNNVNPTNNPDYYEYLMMCQRHSDSNFIHYMESKEIIYDTSVNSVKIIGPYALGDVIGKGIDIPQVYYSLPLRIYGEGEGRCLFLFFNEGRCENHEQETDT